MTILLAMIKTPHPTMGIKKEPILATIIIITTIMEITIISMDITITITGIMIIMGNTTTTITITTIISTIGTLQLFDEVNNITQGGPSDSTLTLSLYIYNLTFKFMPSFGYSATVSWVIVVLVGILSLIQFLIARDRRQA